LISIADAIILAGLIGLLGFLWHEKYRMEMLEEENEELWENFSMMVDHINQVQAEVENIKNGNSDSED
jgi:hypothetical protein